MLRQMKQILQLGVVGELSAEAKNNRSYNGVFSVRYVLRQTKQIFELSVLCEIHAKIEKTDLVTDCSPR